MSKNPQYLDWHTSEFVCKKCGQREKPELPASVKQLSLALKEFEREHENCEEG